MERNIKGLQWYGQWSGFKLGELMGVHFTFML